MIYYVRNCETGDYLDRHGDWKNENVPIYGVADLAAGLRELVRDEKSLEVEVITKRPTQCSI